MKYREDLRHLCVCSVDPPGCTDIDDALHCRELENGNIEVLFDFFFSFFFIQASHLFTYYFFYFTSSAAVVIVHDMSKAPNLF